MTDTPDIVEPLIPLCVYCFMPIHQAEYGIWVDDTDGDGCSGDDNLANENGVHSPETLYNIVRFHQDAPREVISEWGVTLAEAQAHCQRDDTKGDGWFDGYEAI